MDPMEDAEKQLELTRYLRQEQNLKPDEGKNREDICTELGKNSEMLYMETMVWNWQNMTESGSRGIRAMFGLRLASA